MNKLEKLLKRPLAYKIDKNDEKILQTTIFTFIFIMYSLSLLILIMIDYKDFEQLKLDIITKVLFALIPTILITIIITVLFYKELMKIRNIQKLAELIFSSRYYINPQITVNKGVKHIFDNLLSFDGLIGERKKFKTLYFPKFYISQKNNEIKIYIYLDGSNFQEEFLRLDKKLELVYGMSLTNKYIENEHQVYILKTFNEKERINFSQIDNKAYTIKFMNNLYWNFRKEPHGLITGATASGKTYLLLYLIKEILRKGYYLKIIDPKKSDLSSFEQVSKNIVSYNKEDIIETIREVNQEMENRYLHMLKYQEKNQGLNFGEDFVFYKMMPYFILFDEQAAFILTLDTKEKKEVDNLLKNIILKGRQAGINIIFTLQRPDTQFIDGAVRDQLHFRLGLGLLSQDGYRMLFENTDSSFKELEVVGYGYYKILGLGKFPKIFLSPYIDDKNLVYQEISRLIKERKL